MNFSITLNSSNYLEQLFNVFKLQFSSLFGRSTILHSSVILLSIMSMIFAEQVIAQQEQPAASSAVPAVSETVSPGTQAEPSGLQPVPTGSQTEPAKPKVNELAPETAPQTKGTDVFDSIDPQRNYLSGKITSFASYVDRFFSGDRHYQESNESVIQLDLTRIYGFGGEQKFDFEAKLNFKLPNTEGRFRLLLETNPEKNITTEPPTPGSTVLRDQVAVPKTVAVAARYAVVKESNWHFSTDAGLRLPIPIKPFLRSRLSYSIPMGVNWRFKAAETVFWFDALGWGETSQMDFERVLNPLMLFRASSTATWLEDKKNFDLRQDFSVYHTLDDRTALLYQASASGVSNPSYAVTDYVLLVFYRYRLHRKWIFFEISPQLHYPQIYNYQVSTALSMRLEVLFDDAR